RCNMAIENAAVRSTRQRRQLYRSRQSSCAREPFRSEGAPSPGPPSSVRRSAGKFLRPFGDRNQSTSRFFNEAVGRLRPNTTISSQNGSSTFGWQSSRVLRECAAVHNMLLSRSLCFRLCGLPALLSVACGSEPARPPGIGDTNEGREAGSSHIG